MGLKDLWLDSEKTPKLFWTLHLMPNPTNHYWVLRPQLNTQRPSLVSRSSREEVVPLCLVWDYVKFESWLGLSPRGWQKELTCSTLTMCKWHLQWYLTLQQYEMLAWLGLWRRLSGLSPAGKSVEPIPGGGVAFRSWVECCVEQLRELPRIRG